MAHNMQRLRSQLTRTASCLSTRGTIASSVTLRNASTSQSSPSRRHVTIMNDDGRIAWSHLTAREKLARTTQQSFNLGIIVIGMALTGAVGYLLFTDVFSPSSKTVYFNRAISRVKAHPRCLALLGPPDTIMAYGESPWSSFARARLQGPSPTSSLSRDPHTGIDTLKMRFMVKGAKAQGWVSLHVELKGNDETWVRLTLDVGSEMVWLQGGNLLSKSDKPKPGTLFGLKLW